MKKRVITLCMMLLLLFVMIGCGDSNVEEIDWVNIRLGDVLPEPKSKSMKILTNSDENLSVYICNTSQNDYYEYTRLCEDNGFSIDVEYIGDSFYGFNDEGYYLGLSYYGSNKEMHISLDEPMEFGEYTWPAFAVELGLSQPVSAKGAYNWEDTDRFSLNVGDTSLEEYSAYVDVCTNAGFTIDSSKGEKSFYGDNEQGYHINVSYRGYNTMVIWLEAPKKTNNEENVVDREIALPCSDSSYLWTNYQDIVGDFEVAGFTNITTVPLGDLSEDDWFTSEGEYESITVGGKEDFNKGDKHPSDVEIIITYHSYPEDYEKDNVTPTPSQENKIVVTKNEEDFIGLHYSEVEELLRNMGFDDINLKSTYSTNQEYTNGEVHTVYIRDGFFDLGGFKKGDSFSEKAEVTIHYYEVREPEKPKPVFYSTNDRETAKKGNSGVFSYKSKGGSYDVYWIIDFEQGYVYNFTEGNGETSCDRVAIVEGDLNDRITVTWHDGGEEWSWYLHFKYKNAPETLVLNDHNGFTVEFGTTDLDDALELRNSKTIYDY